MSQNTAKTLWLIWGTGLLYFSINSLSAAQGWPFKLSGIKFDNWDRYAVALLAVPLGLIGLTVLCVIGACFAKSSNGTYLGARLPPPFGFPDTESVLLHSAQVVTFIIVPMAAFGSLFTKFLSGSFCRRVAIETSTACGVTSYEVVGTSHFNFVPWSVATSSRAFVYQGGADYWPFWEPLGLVILWLVFFLTALWFCLSVLKTRANPH